MRKRVKIKKIIVRKKETSYYGLIVLTLVICFLGFGLLIYFGQRKTNFQEFIESIFGSKVTTTIRRTTIPTTVKTTTTEEVTTTIEETTTTEKPTTTVSEVNCKYTRFDIKYHDHKNEALLIYLRNLGSEHIYGFGVKLYYPDKMTEITYSDEDIAPKEVKPYTMDVGIELDNVTVYILGCPFNENSKYGNWQYWLNV